jgi:hypothetical protein
VSAAPSSDGGVALWGAPGDEDPTGVSAAAYVFECISG